MKASTALRHIVAALTVTQALGRPVIKDLEFEVRTGDIKSDEDGALAQKDTSPYFSVPPETDESKSMETLDLSNDSKYAIFNESWPSNNMSTLEWEIPVSHAGCSGWGLQVWEIVDSIQKLVDWSDNGGGLIEKSVHYEISGYASAYACNCKWKYTDKVPMREMREFYERLVSYCGYGQSGWIFSKKWEKGFAVEPKCKVDMTRPIANLCPPWCAYKNR
ncbi:hypothetical protein F5Y06DRAFT_255271 [Hypoxylon sp. FL0890]|nr:hypothetical protein F5Y06DRAFT_255271 [Hypoxylon sp. FL0890]